jgi:hypothetical protein
MTDTVPWVGRLAMHPLYWNDWNRRPLTRASCLLLR